MQWVDVPDKEKNSLAQGPWHMTCFPGSSETDDDDDDDGDDRSSILF